MSPHDLLLMEAAARAWDVAAKAHKEIEKSGQTYVDRFDAPRTHPSVTIARDATATFTRIIGQLHAMGLPSGGWEDRPEDEDDVEAGFPPNRWQR